MLFNAAKDLVYTIKGGTISSGGYRINKIVNKKKGKQTQVGGKGSDKDYDKDVYNEDSGIPIGLLLLQRLHYYDDEGDRKQKHAEVVDVAPNRKLVYASIVAESDDDNGHDGDNGDKINNIELVIMPSAAPSGCENPIEISSNEIDDELYDSLVKSVSEPIHNSFTASELTPLRKANATKKQNQKFGKHKDIEKIYQKRKTRSKRHH